MSRGLTPLGNGQARWLNPDRIFGGEQSSVAAHLIADRWGSRSIAPILEDACSHNQGGIGLIGLVARLRAGGLAAVVQPGRLCGQFGPGERPMLGTAPCPAAVDVEIIGFLALAALRRCTSQTFDREKAKLSRSTVSGRNVTTTACAIPCAHDHRMRFAWRPY